VTVCHALGGRAKSKTHFEGTGRPDDFSECVEAAVAGAGPIPGKLTKSEWKKHMSETKHVASLPIASCTSCDQSYAIPVAKDRHGHERWRWRL
jgi:hypothetical protein